MDIVDEDLKHGLVKINVQTLNDLWTLYNIIETDDLIYSKTTREIKIEGQGRPSSKRIPLNVWLKVQKVYFDKDINRLRIHGVIETAPEEYSIKGLHHTLNIELTTTLTIKKSQWFQYQIQNLRKAKKNEDLIIIVSLDNEEACIALVNNFEIEIKSKIISKIPGKRSSELREEAQKKYFSEIRKSLERLIERVESQILIVGPGFTKNSFHQYLQNKNNKLSKRVVALKSTGSGGLAGTYESLRSGIVQSVTKKIKITEEIMLVEEILTRLGRNSGDISYGIEEVSSEIRRGSVDKLLISIELLKKDSEEEKKKIENIIREAETKRGKVHIINSTHEGGKKLLSLGGIAAILRYSKYYRTSS